MHWSERVEKILHSPTGDLKQLASIAGIDSKNFYRFQSLAGCDLRGQDLTGLDLEGCELQRAITDSSTKIDAKFDFRKISDREDDYLRITVSSALNTMVLHYMQEVSYSYSAWAYRSLFETGLYKFYHKQIDFYKGIIDKNLYLRPLLGVRGQGKVPVKVLLYRDNIDLMEQELGQKPSMDFSRLLILVGLLSRRIKPDSKKDYSQLSPNAFYPPRLMKTRHHQRLLID